MFKGIDGKITEGKRKLEVKKEKKLYRSDYMRVGLWTIEENYERQGNIGKTILNGKFETTLTRSKTKQRIRSRQH